MSDEFSYERDIYVENSGVIAGVIAGTIPDENGGNAEQDPKFAPLLFPGTKFGSQVFAGPRVAAPLFSYLYDIVVCAIDVPKVSGVSAEEFADPDFISVGEYDDASPEVDGGFLGNHNKIYEAVDTPFSAYSSKLKSAKIPQRPRCSRTKNPKKTPGGKASRLFMVRKEQLAAKARKGGIVMSDTGIGQISYD